MSENLAKNLLLKQTNLKNKVKSPFTHDKKILFCIFAGEL